MVVSYDITIFVNNKSGTETSVFELLLRSSAKEFLEEIVERIIFLQRTSFELAMYAGTSLSILLRPYVDHGRAVSFSQIGKALRRGPKIL